MKPRSRFGLILVCAIAVATAALFPAGAAARNIAIMNGFVKDLATRSSTNVDYTAKDANVTAGLGTAGASVNWSEENHDRYWTFNCGIPLGPFTFFPFLHHIVEGNGTGRDPSPPAGATASFRCHGFFVFTEQNGDVLENTTYFPFEPSFYIKGSGWMEVYFPKYPNNPDFVGRSQRFHDVQPLASAPVVKCWVNGEVNLC